MKAERCEEGEEVEVKKEVRKWASTRAAGRIRKDETLQPRRDHERGTSGDVRDVAF